jgi:hypothetical protein
VGDAYATGPSTACCTPGEVDVRKFPSPPYVAVSVFAPGVTKTTWQLPVPAVSVAVQNSPVLEVTVTVPVGTPVNCGDTEKLTVTGRLTPTGFGVFEVISVVVDALLIVNSAVL